MKYKRILVNNYGGPEVLRLIEDELPEPKFGEVRIKIIAAGVAWGDVLKRAGYGFGARPPFTPGYDIAGIVDKTGEGVSSVSDGDKIAALTLSGGYAEYICLPVSKVVKIPANVDLAEAVCLVLNYVTAYQMLHRAAKVKFGDRILVHSAAGGVGTAILQLGKLYNLQMYGTASKGKHELVKSLGGIPIDYKQEDFVERILSMTGRGVNIVLDPVGGTHLLRSYKSLRRFGTLVAFGAHSIIWEGKLKVLQSLLLISMLNFIPSGKSVMLYGITRPKYSKPEWCRMDLALLLELLEEKKIKPIIAERIQLSEVKRAHELLESGSVKGKIVIINKE